MPRVTWEKHELYPDAGEPPFNQWFLIEDEEANRRLCFQQGLLGVPVQPILQVGEEIDPSSEGYSPLVVLEVRSGVRVPEFLLDELPV